VPVNVFDPVVAYCPSINVTLEDTDALCAANELEAVVKTEAVLSKFVTLVETDPENVLKEEVNTKEVESKLSSKLALSA
jgi:hypothetical protein